MCEETNHAISACQIWSCEYPAANNRAKFATQFRVPSVTHFYTKNLLPGHPFRDECRAGVNRPKYPAHGVDVK